jgi:hypothetical protein
VLFPVVLESSVPSEEDLVAIVVLTGVCLDLCILVLESVMATPISLSVSTLELGGARRAT